MVGQTGSSQLHGGRHNCCCEQKTDIVQIVHFETFVFRFRPVVQEEIPFKDTTYPELWWPLCSAEQTICAILLEHIIGPVVQEMRFKDISYQRL